MYVYITRARRVRRTKGAGRNPGSVSTITPAEVLVRRYRAGREQAAEVADALLRFPNLELQDVTDVVAREAARVCRNR